MKIAVVGMETSGVMRRQFARLGYVAISVDLLPAQDGAARVTDGDSVIRTGHIQGDVFDALEWLRSRRLWPEVAVFHPDCTFLTNSAEWAYADPDYVRFPGAGYHQKVKDGTLVGSARREARAEAVQTVKRIRALDISRIAIENPIGHLSGKIGRPTQVVQPYDFGDDASKATCLWLYENGELLGPGRGIPLDPSKRVLGRLIEWSGKTVERWANQTDSGQNRLPPSEDRWARRADTYPGIAAALAEHMAGGMRPAPLSDLPLMVAADNRSAPQNN